MHSALSDSNGSGGGVTLRVRAVLLSAGILILMVTHTLLQDIHGKYRSKAGILPSRTNNTETKQADNMGLYADITQPPKALPQAELKQIAPAVSLLPPLSRRGHGPGMILIASEKTEKLMTDGGFPAPIMKWAEEGYAVVEVQGSALSAQAGPNTLETAISGLKACEGFEDTGKIGIVGMRALDNVPRQ